MLNKQKSYTRVLEPLQQYGNLIECEDLKSSHAG